MDLHVDSELCPDGRYSAKIRAFLHREITRHKRPVWYFRRGKGPRFRMPGEFNSIEFLAAYDAALKGARPARPGHAQGTFSWGLSLYRQSQAWVALSPATQRQRQNIFKNIEAALGEFEIAAIGSAATSQQAGTSGLQRRRRPECL